MKPHQPLWGLGGALQGLRSQSRPGSQTPKDPCETGSLPGLLPSFYSISVSRVFSRAGSPFFPHQQAGFSASGLWAPAPLPCQTPHPQPPQPPNLPPTPPHPGMGLRPGVRRRSGSAKNGTIAGRAPPEGREIAGESSSLSSSCPWGS